VVATTPRLDGRMEAAIEPLTVVVGELVVVVEPEELVVVVEETPTVFVLAVDAIVLAELLLVLAFVEVLLGPAVAVDVVVAPVVPGA